MLPLAIVRFGAPQLSQLAASLSYAALKFSPSAVCAQQQTLQSTAGMYTGCGLPLLKSYAKQEQQIYSHQSVARYASETLGKSEGVELHAGLKKQQILDHGPREYSKELLAYSKEYVESIRPTHKPPRNLKERFAFWAIQGTRATFDFATGYKHDVPQTEAQWVRRAVFLETVAGVPGMVGGMLRHLRSLRVMKADKGWIATLLEEAENERMHLLTFMELRKPGLAFRSAVLLAQGIYFNMFFISYLISPKFCHAIVGYLEEEAVKTYTHLIEDIDAGHVWKGQRAPEAGIKYWKLAPDAEMRDMILAIRADEACHSHVNHKLSEIPTDAPNPFVVPEDERAGAQAEQKL